MIPVGFPVEAIAVEMVRKGVARNADAAVTALEAVVSQANCLKEMLDMKKSRHEQRCTSGEDCRYLPIMVTALVALARGRADAVAIIRGAIAWSESGVRL